MSMNVMDFSGNYPMIQTCNSYMGCGTKQITLEITILMSSQWPEEEIVISDNVKLFWMLFTYLQEG